jgi:hypothetical protein
VPLPTSTDFYRLSRPVQDRFIAATRGAAPPAPLLFHAAPRARAWILLGGAVALTLVGVVVLMAGSGDPKSSVALHGVGMLLLDTLLFGGASYAAVHAMALLRRLDGLPFRAGTYLFPGCVVDAREPSLRVWPTAEVESTQRLTAPRIALLLRMRDGSQVTVPARSADELERAETALTSLKGELLRAIAEHDPHALAEMDPLHDNALSNPIGPTEAMKPSLPAWVRLDWAVAVCLGVVLGVGIGTTRNDFSDDAMLRSAGAAGTVAAFKEYLAHGGRHSATVRDVLLPRAELHEVDATGNVDALREFGLTHASSKIGTEIDASIRRALLAQLAEAKKAGTVTALDEFAKKYPDGKVDSEIKAARHALYASALDAWQQKTHPDGAVSTFFSRLLAWAEKNGPQCELRFRFARSKMDDADTSAAKSPRFPGPDAYPSHYIAVDAMRPREARVGDALAKRFSDSFPADILALQQGAPIDEGAAIPAATKPTIVVDYVAEWSKLNTVSTKPSSVFAGVNFAFDSTFNLPDGNPYDLKTKAYRSPEPWKIKAQDLSREDFQKKVYDGIIDGAFDQLDKKLGDALF